MPFNLLTRPLLLTDIFGGPSSETGRDRGFLLRNRQIG